MHKMKNLTKQNQPMVHKIFFYKEKTITDLKDIPNNSFTPYGKTLIICFIYFYTKFIQRSIHKQMCSNALLNN